MSPRPCRTRCALCAQGDGERWISCDEPHRTDQASEAKPSRRSQVVSEHKPVHQLALSAAAATSRIHTAAWTAISAASVGLIPETIVDQTVLEAPLRLRLPACHSPWPPGGGTGVLHNRSELSLPPPCLDGDRPSLLTDRRDHVDVQADLVVVRQTRERLATAVPEDAAVVDLDP